MASLLSKLKEAGFEASEKKTKLWSIKETLETGIDASELDIRASEYDSKQSYVVLQEGEETMVVGFWPGKGLNPEDFTVEFDGKFRRKPLRDVELTLVVAEATRDDKELGIAKGDTIAKFIAE